MADRPGGQAAHRRLAGAAAGTGRLRRYAAICRGPETTAVLQAYERSNWEGLSELPSGAGALRSGAAGPARATAVVRLGPAIDEQEAGAFFSVAAALELAVAGGELRPGARGWRAAQQAVARRHLATPRPELDGHSWLELVVAERLGGWARSRGEARRALVEPVLPRLAGRPLLPLPVPPGAEGRWPRCAGCWHLRARVGESR